MAKVGKSRKSQWLAARVAALRGRMRSWRANALLVTNPVDLRYLTGFSGEDSWALVREGRSRVVVLTDSRFAEQLARQAPQTVQITRTGPLGDEVRKLAHRHGLERIAVQRQHMTLAVHRALVRELKAHSVVPVDDGLLEQRAVKDPLELQAVVRAIRCQQVAFREWVAQIRPGRTENSLAAELELIMRDKGAEGASFPTIVAVGANGSLPHAVPGSRTVKQGRPLLVDWGARWQGYCGDLTRVIAVGTISRRMQRIYEVVRAAQQAAIEAIAPDVPLREVDNVARDIITRAGFGDHFGHGLGHGVGLDIHELPTLSPRGDGMLKVGQIVTVEPGIYLPGTGGVRIEDDVLVTPRGHRVLSDLPTDLPSMTI